MAGLPSNNVVDSWAPEPELREAPPRRYEERSDDYPDLNQPSKILFQYVGGGLLALGLILLVVALVKHQALLAVLSTLMAVGGGVLLGLYPVMLRSHLNRAEQLISFGVPVIARILSVDNMTGDSTYARMVKYQVVMPGGEMSHRTVNADERLLPSRVPADATALMIIATSDVELYCALPLVAAARPEAVSRIPGTAPTPSYGNPAVAPNMPSSSPSVLPDVPTVQPTGEMGAMPTLGGGQMGSIGSLPPDRLPSEALPSDRLPSDRLPSDRLPSDRLPSDRLPSPPRAEPAPEPAPTTKPAEKPGGSSGLPWE